MPIILDGRIYVTRNVSLLSHLLSVHVVFDLVFQNVLCNSMLRNYVNKNW